MKPSLPLQGEAVTASLAPNLQGKAAPAFLEGLAMTDEADGVIGARRKWRKLGAKWQSSFPLDTSNVSLGSWLDEQDEPWGIGCKACRSAGCMGNLAQYLVT